MAVDPGKPRKILLVHGVQSGTDEDQDEDRLVRELLTDRLNGVPLSFETELYRYENINDEARRRLKTVLRLFLDKMAARTPLGEIEDVVFDVVIALKNDATAEAIRQGLAERIEAVFEAGNPLYLVAHSLGSIYAFDVVNRLMRRREYFDRASRRNWPVQALVTLGSPIGLALFRRNRVTPLGPGRHFFRWSNYWDRTDPIVSGSFFGKPQQGYSIAERFAIADPNLGWFIQDHVVDIGRAGLLAHVGYWRHPAFGDDLAAIVTS